MSIIKPVHFFLLMLLLVSFVGKANPNKISYSPYIDSLENQVKQNNLKDTIRLEILQALVREFININIEEAEKYSLQILEIIKNNDNPYWKANAYNTIGLFNWSKSYFTKALDYFLESAKINDSLNNQVGLLRNYGNIGLLNQTIKNYDKAIEYTTKALKLAEKLKMKREMALAYGNLGNIYQETKKFKESLANHTKALKITQEIKDQRGIIRNLSNIAVVHTSMGNMKEALKNYSEALELAIKEKDNRSIVLLEGNLGVTYYKIAKDSNITKNHSDKIKALKLSENYLSRSIELAKKMNFIDALYDYYQGLSNTYVELGDYKNALKYKEFYQAVKDSLFNIENSKIINDLQSKFEKQLVEKENQLLKKENQVKEIAIYASVIIILLVLIGLYFLYRNSKITKKLNQQLEKNNQKIKEANLELERLLEVISIKNIELEETNNILAQTNATKDKLFSIISHDLRNPLQAIILNAELLQNFHHKMNQNEHNERYSQILNSSMNLNTLLEDLLLWSRTQMKRIEANPIDFDISSLINVVVSLHSEQARLKEISIENITPSNLFVYSDMSTINTIFRNLISNAIKFTHQGGFISIGCESVQEQYCEIYVKDTGVGIPKENLSKLFSITHNITTRGTNKELGTGLGLILVNELVQLNNGEIRVESELNKGTKFIIKLPKSNLASQISK